MGWMFTQGATRSEIITDITREQSRNGNVFRTLKKVLRGNTMYCLHENGPLDNTRKFIGIYLLQRGAEGWGYKDMDETMGPYYYNCPVSFLDACDPPVNEYSANWRKGVRAFADAKAAQNRKKPKVGEIWSCTGRNCKRIRIAKVEGRRIEAYNLTGGGYYCIPKKLLGECLGQGLT